MHREINSGQELTASVTPSGFIAAGGGYTRETGTIWQNGVLTAEISWNMDVIIENRGGKQMKCPTLNIKRGYGLSQGQLSCP